MPFITTAMAKAIFRPLRPPIAPPATTSSTLRRISSRPVRRILMRSSTTESTQKSDHESQGSNKNETFGFAAFHSYSELDSRGSRGLFRRRALEAHRVFLPFAVYAHMIARQHHALQDLQRQWILNQPLNGSAQRARPVRRIVAFAQQQVSRRRRQLQRNLPFFQQLLYALQQ